MKIELNRSGNYRQNAIRFKYRMLLISSVLVQRTQTQTNATSSVGRPNALRSHQEHEASISVEIPVLSSICITMIPLHVYTYLRTTYDIMIICLIIITKRLCFHCHISKIPLLFATAELLCNFQPECKSFFRNNLSKRQWPCSGSMSFHGKLRKRFLQ